MLTNAYAYTPTVVHHMMVFAHLERRYEMDALQRSVVWGWSYITRQAMDMRKGFTLNYVKLLKLQFTDVIQYKTHDIRRRQRSSLLCITNMERVNHYVSYIK